MSKELDALRNEMLTKLRGEKAETAKQLEMANAVYKAAEEKITAARAEFSEASRLLAMALKADLDVAKELRKMDGSAPVYVAKPKPEAKAPARTPAHRRIVRVRNAMPPQSPMK